MDIIDNVIHSITTCHHDKVDLRKILNELYIHGWNAGHEKCQHEYIKNNRKKKAKDIAFEKRFSLSAQNYSEKK